MRIPCVTGDFVDGNGLLRNASDSVTEALLALAASAPRSAGIVLNAQRRYSESGRAPAAETSHG
jgi:hypothetical protein